MSEARANPDIDFESCWAFRDLGGYPTADGHMVRRSRLYRSMSPQWMTEKDLRFARDELLIRPIVDLREKDSGVDSGQLGEPPATRLHVPLLNYRGLDLAADVSREVYLQRQIEANGSLFVEALEFMSSSEEGAAVFHCHSGKDRTGILAALALKLLGVSDEHIMADYLATTVGFAASLPFFQSQGIPFPPRPGILEFLLGPPEEPYLTATLSALDSHGGAEAYLLAAGASPEMISWFREWLLE